MKADNEWNKTIVQSISTDWKAYAVKINARQKLVKISPDDFELAVAKKMLELKGQFKKENKKVNK